MLSPEQRLSDIRDLIREKLYFVIHDFSYVRDLGLVENRNGTVCISNPIYQEIIPRVLSFHVQASIALTPAWFLKENGTLDVMKLIESFFEFWREHGEVLLQGMPYHEAAPHLVFMAYLQRVVNHGGRIDREFAIGTGRHLGFNGVLLRSCSMKVFMSLLFEFRLHGQCSNPFPGLIRSGDLQ